MAKYLDSNGLSHFMTLIKSAFSVKTHTHSITPTTGAACSVTPGSAASLSTNTVTITPVTSKTVVTGVTPMSATVSSGECTLVITADSASTGDSVNNGTAVSIKEVDTFTANTPTAVTANTVVTGVSATGQASA